MVVLVVVSPALQQQEAQVRSGVNPLPGIVRGAGLRAGPFFCARFSAPPASLQGDRRAQRQFESAVRIVIFFFYLFVLVLPVQPPNLWIACIQPLHFLVA